MLLLISFWILVIITYTVIFIKKDAFEGMIFDAVLFFVSILIVLPIVIFTVSYIQSCYEIEFINKLHNTIYTFDEWFFNKKIISQLLNI